MSLSVMADKADEYRQYAQECFEAAERMHSEEEREILLHIAQTWQHLANEEEDASRAEHGTRAAKSPRLSGASVAEPEENNPTLRSALPGRTYTMRPFGAAVTRFISRSTNRSRTAWNRRRYA
jgi:hypothetical protein